MCKEWHDVEGWPSRCVSVRVVARSELAVPQIIRDFDEPVQSMADGQYYTNKAALRRTYRADGNPHGVEYQEVGTNDTRTAPQRKPVTESEVAVMLDKAEAKVARGEVPEALNMGNT
jgi:hypothetical protein